VLHVDAACCYRPSSVACRSVAVVSPAKAAELLEMSFELTTQVGPSNRVLDGVHIPMGRDNFEGGGCVTHYKV